MTLQERILAEPQDILAIRLTCTCGSSLNMPIGEREYVPEACPYCHEAWFAKGSTDHQYLRWLMDAIGALRKRGPEVQCHVHLELKPDK